MSEWIECSLEEAAERARLTVTVLGSPKRVEVFEVTREQYILLFRLCHPNVRRGNHGEVVRRPLEFELTVINKKDLGREGLTVDRVIAVCAGYVGHALEATEADRKLLEKKIYEAGVKRRGGELDGGAGYGKR